MNPTVSHILRTTGIAASCVACAGLPVSAQLVINEIFENPPNGGDSTWEYIELAGPPGYDLSGYAVALLKGGRDNEAPFGAPEGEPEIDEAFTLDGWTVGPDGFFVIFNRTELGATGLDSFLIDNPGYLFFQPESPTNKRFLNGASMPFLHIPSVDTVGNLSNDDSSTYLLVRKRPDHSLDGSGMSVYGPEYAWKKDANPDVDFNSRLDFGDEDTLGVPLYVGNRLGGTQAGPLTFEPVQIVDEVSWSNNAGKEYNTPGRGDLENKLSETPRFNPDTAARARYGTATPRIGARVNNSGELITTSLADESWVYGETLNVAPGSATYGVYKPLLEVGPDMTAGTTDDELNYLAPTDPAGNTYNYAGPGDDNPLEAPYLTDSPALDPQGTLLFEPYDISGFTITPGAYNDAPAGSQLASTPIGTQFRFVTGDLTFDGVVDLNDLAAAQASLGADLDDQSPAVNDRNTDDPSDDATYTAWTHQLEGFNALLALVRMDLTDGTTGTWDSGTQATQSDVDALAALLPNCSLADTAEPFGAIDAADIDQFIVSLNAHEPFTDVTGDTVFDFFDYAAWLPRVDQGCP